MPEEFFRFFEKFTTRAETCFSLEKLKLRGKFDLDRVIEFHPKEIIIKIYFDFILYYDNITVKKIYSIIQTTIIHEICVIILTKLIS